MRKKPTYPICFVYVLTLLIFSSLLGCGDLSGEENTERLRFVEFILFPTAPYVNKSYIEVVSEDEIAFSEIDFDTEITTIQEVYTAFINAYVSEDINALSETFDTAQGIEFGSSTGNVYGWHNIRKYIESNWQQSDCGVDEDWKLTDFYMRPKNVTVPWTEASATGPMFYYDPGSFLCYVETGQFYFTKKAGKWRIHQIDGGKYFTDTKYKVPNID